MNVLLIGMRAAGKSTIGPLLARELRREFIELDEWTAREMGQADAASAIRANGIEAFRLAEVRALGAALRDGGRVISLGGGTPTAPGAVELVQSERSAGRALVIFLDLDAPAIRARIAADGVAKRPPILGVDALAEVEEVLAARRPIYRSIADLCVEVRGGKSDVVAGTLVAFVRNRGG